MSNPSKSVLAFQRLCKEVDLIKSKIDACKKEEQAKIKVFKSNIIEYQGKIENAFDQLTKKENDEYIENYMSYKEMLLDLSVNLEEKTEVNFELESSSDLRETKNVKPSLIKLPDFNLVTFFGDVDKWISFREVFSETILKNTQLSKIQKLQYLQASVRGDAAKLIRGYSLQEQNLEQCWEVLCERYENKRQLALSQLNKIFTIKINKASTSKALLELLDTCNETVRNLKTLGLESTALSDLIFIRFMLSKLDDSLKQRWELLIENDKMPDLDSFRKFIEREARSVNETSENKIYSNKTNTYQPKKVSVINSVVNNKQNCLECGQLHPLYKCFKFNNKTVNERWKLVKEKKLCTNCLRENHVVDNCRINISCKNCSARHHTLLHIYSVNNSTRPQEQTSVSVTNSAQSKTNDSDNGVLLATALVMIRGHSGKIMECKALLDNGSQNSLISKRCARELNLELKSTNHKLVGINQITAETCLYSTQVKFCPYFNEHYQNLNALVVEKITTPLPNFRLDAREWPHTTNLPLADPMFFKPQNIDLLIGADLFGTLITGPPIPGNYGEPVVFPTTLGHVLMGPIMTKQPVRTSVACHTIDLKTFFELEDLPLNNVSCVDDATHIYNSTTKRNETGRYIVKLPFEKNCCLGNSEIAAKKIFHSVERKLAYQPELKCKYDSFMEEYSQLGHMSVLTEPDLSQSPNYYLPHHAVQNENSSTTSVRVVFNASMPSSNGNSLNSILLKGPKLQTSIFSHLLKFRQYKFALTADIAKMYRQILVDPDDTHFQRVFWRRDPGAPLLVYKLNTVTYGVVSSPFLALKTIQKLCSDEESNFPRAAKIAKDHFYVDDFLGGADSYEEAEALVLELQELFRTGGFELRKWSSNNATILAKVPEPLRASTVVHEFKTEQTQRILGLQWTCESDSLQVIVGENDIVNTKRQLLSIIARIFDPLGLLAPSIILLKTLLKEVWMANLGWDDQLPLAIQEKWDRFQSELHLLQHLKIPRFLNISSDIQFEAHGFCDASLQAYAAVVYLKTISDNITVSLVAAKTRIAPTKTITLPRLELCGALLLADLMRSIKDSLPLCCDTFYWTDSSITLCWILNPPQKGNPFVLHRANKIGTITNKCEWHHIPGKHNPADCLTRGLYPAQLQTTEEWLHGPSWLYDFSQPLKSVSSSTMPCTSSALCDEVSAVSDSTDKYEILKHFSSYTKLIRIIAWLLRFKKNSLSSSKTTGPLSTNELSTSRNLIFKLWQEEVFTPELNLFKADKPLNKNHPFIALNLFLDPDNLIRVGGRLRHHPYLKFETKHPLLIPKNHPLTEAIIRYYHLISLHSGPELVLSLIRQTFWIPDGRSTVKRELRKCIRCAHFTTKPMVQQMGDLPISRITPCRPFEQVGIDFAGPILTKCQHTRKYSTFKGYICLFICMSTKAVHLELVSSLSTEAFVSTLRRFIARRGHPTDIFTDNGGNFVGAASYLKNLMKLYKNEKVQNFCAIKNISWHFMPPYGPNFGGLWESSIKLAKRHLSKTLNGVLLNFEELSTLLCLIEACINSRPIMPLSTDPHDLNALTPGHFLIGSALLDLPDHKTMSNVSLSYISRWKIIAESRRKFWQRWTTDYLHTLHPRRKWSTVTTPPSKGDLVLVRQPSLQPTQWNLGRIEELHPGQDGLCRVATIRTSQGLYKRPLRELGRLQGHTSSTLPPGGLDTKGSL